MAEGGKKISAIYCSKCSSRFNVDARTPRTLPCNHTLCQRCVQEILDKSEDHLKCPICCKQHEVPCTKDASAYPVNEDKLEIIRLLQENEKQKEPEQKKDQQNQRKDSQSRSKGENEELKAADKAKGAAKNEGMAKSNVKKNEQTTKGALKNDTTSEPADKGKKDDKPDGKDKRDKAKSKCQKVETKFNRIFILYLTAREICFMFEFNAKLFH